MKKVKIILDIALAILSVFTIGYCIATWNSGDEEDVIDAEVIE